MSLPTVITNDDLSGMRLEYARGELNEVSVEQDPIQQFEHWLDQAINCKDVIEANAMCLGTSTLNGKPCSRMVLLKMVDKHGFTFFTNYNSSKGKEIANNPNVALTFWWPALERQVRVEGRAEKIPPKVSDDYFKTRPVKSQIGAIVSPQSEVIQSKETITAKFNQLLELYPSAENSGVPDSQKLERPSNWGGYLVRPESIEFWQGARHRLHDRLLFTKSTDAVKGQWKICRLAP